jgi:hypothetical protein
VNINAEFDDNLSVVSEIALSVCECVPAGN